MLLSDTARKVLRILWSMHRQNAARIDLQLLSRRAQRSPNQVLAALRELQDCEYIVREGDVVRVLQAWEPQRIFPRR